MNFTTRLDKLVILACIYLISIKDAHAYLDPGTGSYIFQILIAVLAGALFGIKIFWHQVKAFLANLFSKNKKDDEA
ncbi:MAG: hypothetical protein WC082_08890 [Victivallales bacterium]